jgi:hypothetical protein
MSKFLNVSTGDYKITVKPSGDIILDTGFTSDGPGRVIIKGNLLVEGDTTSVNTTELTFEDNIIYLNRPDDSTIPNFNGVQRDSGTSGIRIERGIQLDALWLFDEKLRYIVPETGTSRKGAWSPRDQDNNIIGVELSSITTPNGSDLNLLGVYANGTELGAGSTGLVTVRGTASTLGTGNAYTNNILALPIIDRDDVIPNVFYVNNAVLSQLSSSFQTRIQSGTFSGTETSVAVSDDTISLNPSVISLSIDGIVRAEIKEAAANFYNVEISGSNNNPGVISSKSSIGNQDLILFAEGVGRVIIRDNIVLTRTPHNGTGVIDPDAPVDGVSVYNKEEGPGGSGVYFVNQEGTRNELISNNKALVYSILF